MEVKIVYLHEDTFYFDLFIKPIVKKEHLFFHYLRCFISAIFTAYCYEFSTFNCFQHCIPSLY